MGATLTDLIEKRRIIMGKIVELIASERDLELTAELRRELGDATEVAYRQWFRPMDLARPDKVPTAVEVLLLQVYELDAMIMASHHSLH